MLPLAQTSFLNEKEVVQKAGKERINDFLRNHVCYDLLKQSGKVSLNAHDLVRVTTIIANSLDKFVRFERSDRFLLNRTFRGFQSYIFPSLDAKGDMVFMVFGHAS